MTTLRVSTKSIPSAVAGAIAGVLKENSCLSIEAIGAGATNQALKAIAIARGFLAPCGIDIACVPSFASTIIEDKEHTCMKILVKVCNENFSEAVNV